MTWPCIPSRAARARSNAPQVSATAPPLQPARPGAPESPPLSAAPPRAAPARAQPPARRTRACTSFMRDCERDASQCTAHTSPCRSSNHFYFFFNLNYLECERNESPSQVRGHFMFSVESTGVYKARDIFTEAVKVSHTQARARAHTHIHTYKPARTHTHTQMRAHV